MDRRGRRGGAGIAGAVAWCRVRRRPDTRRPSMLDAVLLTSTLAFFLLGLAYVRGSDHL